jgi:hypothetical protein
LNFFGSLFRVLLKSGQEKGLEFALNIKESSPERLKEPDIWDCCYTPQNRFIKNKNVPYSKNNLLRWGVFNSI